MTDQENTRKRLPPPRNAAARRFAFIILFVFLVAVAFSLPLTISGDIAGAGRICLGAVGINVVVLLFGAWFSARSPQTDDDAAPLDREPPAG
jgi:hypothetical protein